MKNEWKEYANRLENFFLCEAECPCCGKTKKCVKDCTILNDDPNYADRMEAIREVLATRPKK